jgi:Flp pilus assembly CpaF family ATPase
LTYSPFVDATLGDGSRLHVVIPDITRRHWAVNIRRLILCKSHTTSGDLWDTSSCMFSLMTLGANR